MIFKRQTRVINGETEITPTTGTIGSGTTAMNLQTTSAVYVGFREKFTARHFAFGTANVTSSALTVKYWNGTAWTAVEDQLDLTSLGGVTFGQDGFVSWSGVDDWARSEETGVSDTELYWAQFTVSVHLHADTTLQSVTNIFTDAPLLRTYYPELVSDTRFLPSGRTDFYEQFDAASKLVAVRLEQKKLIVDISQIVEPQEVAIATTHAAAFIILNGIPGKSEEMKAAASDAYDLFQNELDNTRLSMDFDNSGETTTSERDIGPVYNPRT